MTDVHVMTVLSDTPMKKKTQIMGQSKGLDRCTCQDSFD